MTYFVIEDRYNVEMMAGFTIKIVKLWIIFLITSEQVKHIRDFPFKNFLCRK